MSGINLSIHTLINIYIYIYIYMQLVIYIYIYIYWGCNEVETKQKLAQPQLYYCPPLFHRQLSVAAPPLNGIYIYIYNIYIYIYMCIYIYMYIYVNNVKFGLS